MSDNSNLFINSDIWWHSGKSLFAITNDGKVILNGKELTDDKEVVEGLRKFVKELVWKDGK